MPKDLKTGGILVAPNHFKDLSSINIKEVKERIVIDVKCFIVSINYNKTKIKNGLDYREDERRSITTPNGQRTRRVW